MMDLVKRVLEGDARACARVLRIVDDRLPACAETLKALFPSTGKAFVVGITGNPGAGKSTLTDRVIQEYRAKDAKIGVIAVDPSSPYSGGAILGDRIRMQRHATDPKVFIRSVATRGHLGGLSRSARDMVRVLDAWGADVVLVETVGVGQDELEITRTAHTTLVVMAPGMGDDVQALKAGIMESADVFAVNKADRDGADSTIRDVELMIALGKDTMIKMGKAKGHTVHGETAGLGAAAPDATSEVWTPPIFRCVATRGEGVKELVAGLELHRAWLASTETGRARRTERLAEEVRESLREALIEAAAHDLRDEIRDAVRDVAEKRVDPYTASEQLVARFRGR
jgi:LAO/AO transport system kinase